MASISWTEFAQSDLKAIRKHISKDSAYHADLLLDGIYERVQTLLRFPEFGKKLPELPGKEYRELLYKSYRIIYRVDSNTVYILTIYHTARLLKHNSLFKNELGE